MSQYVAIQSASQPARLRKYFSALKEFFSGRPGGKTNTTVPIANHEIPLGSRYCWPQWSRARMNQPRMQRTAANGRELIRGLALPGQPSSLAAQANLMVGSSTGERSQVDRWEPANEIVDNATRRVPTCKPRADLKEKRLKK
jgi:hypothetical protein